MYLVRRHLHIITVKVFAMFLVVEISFLLEPINIFSVKNIYVAIFKYKNLFSVICQQTDVCVNRLKYTYP
jgi:hypothetical protein